MSNFGTQCDRKLWYSVNEPEQAKPLPPHVRFKFLYGDILEEFVLGLAKEAGHEVVGEQDELEIDGVVGHRDAVIDGVLIDVKSANSRTFAKFKKPVLDDTFGYIDQLNLYMEASKDDPLVKIKKVGGFLVVDKELGHIHLRLEPKLNLNWAERIASKKKIVGTPVPPSRGYSDKEDGKSGNRILGTFCSYCNFNHVCWPGLRTFISSGGPKYYTVVKRTPDMLEVKT